MNRGVRQLVKARQMKEGAGVTIQRTIGTPERPNLDPFLMLDYFSSDNPDDYIAGFPDHPHRGFITLTYMIDGHLLHKDHMGNKGNLTAGGVQWMKAARGVIHSEMPQQDNGLMRGFQLWINLPGREKMTDPEYQDFRPEDIPEIDIATSRIKVLSGHYREVVGPIRDPHTELFYIDAKLNASQIFEHSFDGDNTAFLFLFEGNLMLGQTPIPTSHLVVLGQGERLSVTAGEEGARFILVSGKAIREPVVQYGPFVMNTRDEIEQTVLDYQLGRLTS